MKLRINLLICAFLISACSVKTPENTSTDTASPLPINSIVDSYAKMYFVADTGTELRLFSEVHSLSSYGGDLTVSALNDLLSGEKPLDPDYVNLWDSKSKLLKYSVSGDNAIVDVHFENLNVGASAEQKAIEQIIYTIAVQNEQINAVEFLRDGKKVESFAGHVDTTGKFLIDEGHRSLATVDLDLEEGALLERPFLVTGLACTFEANVPWEITQGNKVIASGAQTAGEACPVRSKFEINLSNLTSGEYVIRVWESSMEDGSLINQDTKSFRID